MAVLLPASYAAPVAYLCAIIVLLYAIASYVTAYGRLRHIRGPLLAGWSRLWLIRSTYRRTLYSDLAQVCKEYGSLARVAPNDLVTNDPDIIRHMNAARSRYTKSAWYRATAISHKRSHLFSETDEKVHVERKKKMAAGYSRRDLPFLEECMDNRLTDFFTLIKNKYTSARAKVHRVDLAQKLLYLGIDFITEIACGEPFGFLAKDDDVHGYIKTQTMLLPIFEWLSTIPALESFIRTPLISRCVMPTPNDKEGVGVLMGIAKRTAAERFGAEKKVKKDTIGSWIEHGLPQEQIEVESVLQVLAGSDSTVTAIRAITLFIATNPKVYSRLQAELDQAPISGPIISESESKDLPYLQACINEGIRMFPPVTALSTKVVPEGGDTLQGQFIPAGTNIIYAAWDFYKNREIFSEDAEIFRPERWLEASSDRLAKMQRMLDLVFGYGQYGCLGKPLALLEINKVIPELFRRYDITLINPAEPWKSYNRNGFFFQSNMLVHISEREQYVARSS